MTKKRLLVLMAGMGGGTGAEGIWSHVEDHFDGKINPNVGTNNSVQDRARITMDAILKTEPDTELVIYTYSGGGFVLRYLLSLLRHESYEHYCRIKKVVVNDGAILGATVPLAYLFMFILDNNKGYPLGQNMSGEDNKWLHWDITKQILYKYPHWNEDWRESETINEEISLEPHELRNLMLEEIESFDDGRPWGEGIIKVAASNGGTQALFDPSTGDYKGMMLNAEHEKHPERGFHIRLYCMGQETPIDSAKNYFLKYFNKNKPFTDTKIKKVQLYWWGDEDSHYEACPGCYNNVGDRGKEIMKKIEDEDKDKVIHKKFFREHNSYIPTVSSLFLQDKTVTWPVGKTVEGIGKASVFDRLYFNEVGVEHGNKQWRNKLIEELKTND